MYKSLSKLFISKISLVGALMTPVVSWACLNGPETFELKRNYAGIASLPAKKYLHLNDDNCWNQPLEKIILTASSNRGPGLATLIVNGIPVGPSQQFGAGLESREFPLDPIDNHLGTQLQDMEIRLSGDFYVEGLKAEFGAPLQPVQVDPWSRWQTFVAFTPYSGAEGSSSTTMFPENLPPLKQIILVAREAAFNLFSVTLNFNDQSHLTYGGAYIYENDARGIWVRPGQSIASIIVNGQSGNQDTKSRLEIRAKAENASLLDTSPSILSL